MNRTLGLVLGGGGARGIAHVGFLQALDEEEIYPDYIAGCSMGSIVGAAYASGMKPEQIKEIALNLKLKDIAKPNLGGLRTMGLLKTEKIRDLLISVMGDITFDQLKIPFRCNAVDIMSGKAVTFSEGSVIDAIIASSSIPSVFEPIKKNGMVLLDGGVLDRMPAQIVKDMGAERIVAVDPIGTMNISEEPSGLIPLILRMFDVQDMQNTARLHLERKYIDLWLEPSLGSMNQYMVKDLDFAYEKGYELGKANVKNIKRLVHPLRGTGRN
ncbi:MAG: patatin-like phospholipase family protein [Clostridia bacterium]|nr:patatin-like phospholipase family protein [Clostridia bacterium]